MKLIFGVILAVFMISSTVSLPARNPNDDAEVVVVPLEKQGRNPNVRDRDDYPDFNDFKGVVETDAENPFFSLAPYNPFNWNFGFFDNFDDVFRRLREHISHSFSEVPQPGSENWPIDDDAKGNTTSTVKIVGDHKVVINDTVYTKKGEYGSSVFNIRVIKVLPLDGSEDVPAIEHRPNGDSSEIDSGSPEIMERQPKDNEVLGNIDSTESTAHEVTTDKAIDIDPESDRLTEADWETQQKNEDIFAEINHPDQKYTKPLQSEFSSEEESYVTENYAYPNEWETFDDHNDHHNEIDMYEHIPIDLSNDIAVNQILADKGTPFNPDADVFSVQEFLSTNSGNEFESVPITDYRREAIKK